MLFSIIIPTYNRRNKIENAINSVLQQTYHDYEIIVVDDGSTDSTEDYILSLKIQNLQYIKKENGGKHTALNRGISTARGELFVILDSDDRLMPYALEEMGKLWMAYDKENLCGIMGRCIENGKLIGLPFESGPCYMTYIDFHFGKNGGRYKDCCECLRTDIFKQYSWPEDPNTRFVPEAYVTDQVGLKYKLLCVDNTWVNKEYLNDGITQNYKQHRKKNCVGYLYNVVSKLDDVFPYCRVQFVKKVAFWWQYWNLVSYDSQNLGKRTKKVTKLGWIIKMLMPIINHIKKAN